MGKSGNLRNIISNYPYVDVTFTDTNETRTTIDRHSQRAKWYGLVARNHETIAMIMLRFNLTGT